MLLILLLLLTMAGCGTNNPIAPNEPEIDTDGVAPDLLTFRAEVLEIDQYYYLRHEEAFLFVYSITPVGSHENGGRYFINRNDSIVVLDAHGEPMSYSDIPSGAIVDITYSAVVLQTDPAIIPGATLIQVVAAIPEPAEPSPTPASEEIGVIPGDVLFNDIPISQLFTEPFPDLLGEPIDQSGDSFSYEGLLITGDRGDLMGYDNMAIQLSIWGPQLALLELNGISLDTTRAGLRAAFGVPHRTSGPTMLIYRVSSPTIAYMVQFRFEDWEDDAPVFNISLFQPAWDDDGLTVSESVPEQLAGIWRNDLGAVLTFPDVGWQVAQWVTYPVPTGAYRIYSIAECGAHSTFWLFPVGVEMIRYGTNGSLVPSDTSVVRLYQGSFEVTTCCPDKEILLEVFYRTTE